MTDDIERKFQELVAGVELDDYPDKPIVSDLSDAGVRVRLTAIRADLETRGESEEIKTERGRELHLERAVLILEGHVRGILDGE